MKTLLTVILGLFIGFGAVAQSALEVFSPDKKRFYLFVDGLKENDSPKSKVRIKNLPEGPHHIKIIFENREINTPQARVQLERAKDYTYEIKLYSNLDRQWYALNLVETKAWSPKEVKKKASGDSLSTAQLLLASSKADSILLANSPAPIIEKPKDTVLAKGDSTITPMDTSTLNCTVPMHPSGFNLLLQKVNAEADDQSKIILAQSLLPKNCLSSIQIMELLQLFEFEVSKLELASWAFDYCFDPVNYQFVEDVFEFDSSVNELHNKIYAERK